MTRKIVALLLITLLLLSLPACKEETKDTHLDWVFIPSSASVGVLTEDGYYYERSGILNYADLATGTSVILCQKPGCKHEYGLEGAAQCDAEMPTMWMVFGNDTLYNIYRNTLYSRNATGGELKELGTLAKELVEEGISVDVFPLSVSNGYLYYYGSIKETEQTASGGTSSVQVGSCTGRFNLAQRKDEILLASRQERSKEGGELIAARENGILYLHREGLDPKYNWKEMETKEYMEALYKTTVQIRHLDLTTGETAVLYTTTYGECKTVHALENGKIYYGGTYDGGYRTCSYDLNTGKVETVYKGEFSSSYYGKGYWQRSKWLDAKTAERHIYDMNTGKTLPIALSSNYYVVNQSDCGMVMYYNNLSTHDGHYYISYDSLADGLQEADLKFLYNMNT
jgi:hypothetical protein